MAKSSGTAPAPPVNRRDYRPMPLALLDALSVCERCWALVGRFHQEAHDAWHAALSEAIAVGHHEHYAPGEAP